MIDEQSGRKDGCSWQLWANLAVIGIEFSLLVFPNAEVFELVYFILGVAFKGFAIATLRKSYRA